MNRLLVFFVLFFSVNVLATHVAVLETMADGDAKDSLSLLDRQYLTNVLREQAMKELPAKQGFTIMTRENISAMLPPGKAIEDCEGSCLVETGRNIAADYICQARVGRFGTKLTLTAELYETAGNKLIASFNGRGSDVEELLKLIEDKSPEFFRSVKELNEPEVSPVVIPVEPVQDESLAKEDSVTLSAVEGSQADSSSVIPTDTSVSPDTSTVTLSAVEGPLAEPSESKVGESIPANVNDEPAKKGGIHWIPLGISAVVTAVGVTAAIVGNQQAKKESEKTYTTEAEYEKYHQNAKDYQKTRGVGIGLAIAGALGVGLSIVF
jgi:hypothetical protein